MEKANLNRRSLSQTEQDSLRRNIRKIEQLRTEKRTATASRCAAIDADIRTLNKRCDAAALGYVN